MLVKQKTGIGYCSLVEKRQETFLLEQVASLGPSCQTIQDTLLSQHESCPAFPGKDKVTLLSSYLLGKRNLSSFSCKSESFLASPSKLKIVVLFQLLLFVKVSMHYNVQFDHRRTNLLHFCCPTSPAKTSSICCSIYMTPWFAPC